MQIRIYRFITGLMVLLLLSLTSCNTMKGLGEDIEAAGEAITEGSEKAEDKMRD